MSPRPMMQGVGLGSHLERLLQGRLGVCEAATYIYLAAPSLCYKLDA